MVRCGCISPFACCPSIHVCVASVLSIYLEPRGFGPGLEYGGRLPSWNRPHLASPAEGGLGRDGLSSIVQFLPRS